jgi:aspartate aminotransferase-like enzyme
MLKEGNQIKKSKCMAEATRRGLEALGLKTFAKAPAPSVTAMYVPAGIDSTKLRNHLEEKYNCTIAGGQDHLKGKIIRVGHLGNIGRKETLETIEQERERDHSLERN